jgi:hypothetical protein
LKHGIRIKEKPIREISKELKTQGLKTQGIETKNLNQTEFNQ